MDFEQLAKHCTIAPDRHELNAHILQFTFEGAVTTIRIGLKDAQSGADMVITDMTTLPHKSTGRGFGTKALQTLLSVAKESGLSNIQAVQVQSPSERFWTRNGFQKLGNVTNDFRFLP